MLFYGKVMQIKTHRLIEVKSGYCHTLVRNGTTLSKNHTLGAAVRFCCVMVSLSLLRNLGLEREVVCCNVTVLQLFTVHFYSNPLCFAFGATENVVKLECLNPPQKNVSIHHLVEDRFMITSN